MVDLSDSHIFVVRTENTQALSRVAKDLGRAGVNLVGVCIVHLGNQTMMWCYADAPNNAWEVMDGHDDVLDLKTPESFIATAGGDVPGVLGEIAERIAGSDEEIMILLGTIDGSTIHTSNNNVALGALVE